MRGARSPDHRLRLDLDEPARVEELGDDARRRRARGAERGHVDWWGKRRLAYEIQRKTEGFYVVFQAKAEPSAMDESHRMLSLADEVVRHKVLRIPEKVYGPPTVAGSTAAEPA